MKKKAGLFIIGLLAAMVIGGLQPALLYSGQAGQGNLWDFLIDPGPSTGTKWFGSLSVYFGLGTSDCGILYATVSLTKGGVPYVSYWQSSGPVCVVPLDQPKIETELHSFLDLALSEIYSKIAGCTIGGPIDSLCVHKYYDQGQWKLKSIQNATYFQGDADAAFVGDIQIQVVE